MEHCDHEDAISLDPIQDGIREAIDTDRSYVIPCEGEILGPCKDSLERRTNPIPQSVGKCRASMVIPDKSGFVLFRGIIMEGDSKAHRPSRLWILASRSSHETTLVGSAR